MASRSGCFTNDESGWVVPKFGLIMVMGNTVGCRPLGCYIVQKVTTCSHSKRERLRFAIFVVIATRTSNFTTEIFFGQYLKKYNICHIAVPDLFFLGISYGVFIIQNPLKSIVVHAELILSISESQITPSRNIFRV